MPHQRLAEAFLEYRSDTLRKVSRAFSVKVFVVAEIQINSRELSNWFDDSKLLSGSVLAQALAEEETGNSFTKILTRYIKVVNDANQLLTKFEAKIQKTEREAIGWLFKNPVALVLFSIFGIQRYVCKALVGLQNVIFEFISKNYGNYMLESRPKRFFQCHIEILTKSFDVNPCPTTQEMTELIQRTGLNERQITMWFTNRRSRMRNKISRSDTVQKVDPPNAVDTSPTTDDSLSLIPVATQPPQLSSEDTFFSDIGRQAEVEFYQVMICSNNRNNWDDYAELFSDIGRL